MWEGVLLALSEAAGYVEVRFERSLVRLLAAGDLSDPRRAADRRRRRRIHVSVITLEFWRELMNVDYYGKLPFGG